MAVQSRPHIALITPAPPGSRAGNRATAGRWARLLRSAGLRVSLHGSEAPPPERRPQLILALHAWRSADAIREWRAAFPQCPLVLVMTGTDIYRFQHSHPSTVYDSMAEADALIGLHDRVEEDLPLRFRQKLHIVLQSAELLPSRVASPKRTRFDVLVAGHLREEKDSLRAAYAVRDLPAESRLRVIQMGGAHNPDWARAARRETARNQRYQWLGDRPRWQVRQWMGRARVLVISSRMEGGANVVSEACVAGLPIIASDIAGNRGLLGEGYQGYYPVADTGALRQCLRRAETDPQWLEALRAQVWRLAPGFRPEAEREALLAVLTPLLNR